jgi:hypothetical protein
VDGVCLASWAAMWTRLISLRALPVALVCAVSVGVALAGCVTEREDFVSGEDRVTEGQDGYGYGGHGYGWGTYGYGDP